MKTIEFGTQKREISKLVLGLMRIFQMSAKEVEALVDGALEAGVNTFDLADIYGGGKSEELLGEVLKGRADLRDKIFIQTKCGIRREGEMQYYDNSAEHVKASVEGCLKRLNTDHLDCMMLHRPDALINAEETARAFEDLKREGKVLDFGVSNHNRFQIERLQKYLSFPLAVNQMQLSCTFTPMLDAGFNVNTDSDKALMRDAAMVEYCNVNNMALQSWSSLQKCFFGGLFLGAEDCKELTECIEKTAKEMGVSATAIAVAWILMLPGKMQAVVGTTKPERVKEMAKATDIKLSRTSWYEIYYAAGNKLP